MCDPISLNVINIKIQTLSLSKSECVNVIGRWTWVNIGLQLANSKRDPKYHVTPLLTNRYIYF